MGEQASSIQEDPTAGAGGRRSRAPVIVAVAVLVAVVVGVGVLGAAGGPSSDEALYDEEQLDRAEEILQQGMPYPVDWSSLDGPPPCGDGNVDTYFEWTRSGRGIRVDSVASWGGHGTLESAGEWIEAQLQEAALPAGIVQLDPYMGEDLGYYC